MVQKVSLILFWSVSFVIHPFNPSIPFQVEVGNWVLQRWYQECQQPQQFNYRNQHVQQIYPLVLLQKPCRLSETHLVSLFWLVKISLALVLSVSYQLVWTDMTDSLVNYKVFNLISIFSTKMYNYSSLSYQELTRNSSRNKRLDFPFQCKFIYWRKVRKNLILRKMFFIYFRFAVKTFTRNSSFAWTKLLLVFRHPK